jgi:RimJ/RimL family protein N-acetyltransferase
MKIKEMNAYTHAENGASNHILEKNGMQLKEVYIAEDDINWKWWQMINPTI